MKNNKEKINNSNFIDACHNAVNGLIYATTTQSNIKKQLFIGVCVLILSLFYKLETTQFLCLTFAIFLVIFAEMINTAIETVVDLYTDKYHPKAKIAKDVGAGAVLLMAINSVIVAYFIFIKETSIGELSNSMFTSVVNSPKHLIFASLIITVVLVLLFKALGSQYNKKTPKRVFVPSGQASVAFAILTCIWLNSRSLIVFVLAAMLSLLVFENRIESKAHSLAETIFGSFMGTLIVFLIYGLAIKYGGIQ